jgi:hypothetical protein
MTSYLEDLDDLATLRAAVRQYAEHQTAANLTALCKLAGVELIEVRPLLSIENSDPIGDLLERQGLCRICECPLDPDTGFCPCCADGK